MTINLYVNNGYKEYMDQLKVISEANNKPLSTEICKAVKQYIQNLNDEKDLVDALVDYLVDVLMD